MPSTFDIATAKERFPALNQDQVFLDNAGGSQMLGDAIEAYVAWSSPLNESSLIHK